MPTILRLLSNSSFLFIQRRSLDGIIDNKLLNHILDILMFLRLLLITLSNDKFCIKIVHLLEFGNYYKSYIFRLIFNYNGKLQYGIFWFNIKWEGSPLWLYEGVCIIPILVKWRAGNYILLGNFYIFRPPFN